jgi:hypothetical protein
MNYKIYIQIVLLAIYLPVIIFANAPVIFCMTEEGNLQIEFGFIACDLNPFQGTPSTEADNCGDCTDSTHAIGETHRIALGNNFDIPLIPNTLFCLAAGQNTSRLSCYIEPHASVSDLVGTSILII